MSIISNSDEEFRVGKYGTIGEAYESSVWFHKFVAGLCDYFGYPTTSAECFDKGDRLMYAWAMMNVIQCVKEHSVLWIDGIDKYDVDLLVDSFARCVFDLSGVDVIPPFTGRGLVK